MTDVDVRALAKLARLEVSDAELDKLQREIPGILAFVEQIQKAETAATGKPKLRNVMRDDSNPNEPGANTKDILAAAPQSDGRRIIVKQVVSRKRANS